MIEVCEISKSYRGFDIDLKEAGIGLWIKNITRLTSNKAQSVQALSHVSFQVHNGEIFGIYGANGAGKTTLIKILSGLLLPSEGEVRVNGCTKSGEIKNQISYVSTNGWMGLEWQLTARENIMMYGNLYGLSGKSLDKSCDEVLQSLDVYEARHKRISQLSAGMRQKITIARGLVIDKPVLYLDEPSVSLDVRAAGEFRQLIRAYAANKERCVIMTSHQPEDMAVCDRILFLHHGASIASGSREILEQSLQNRQTIMVKCPNIGADLTEKLRRMKGVASVLIDAEEGKRGETILKVGIRRNETTVSDIIDFFIAGELPILEIRMKKATLQEVYEHHVNGGPSERMEDGGVNA